MKDFFENLRRKWKVMSNFERRALAFRVLLYANLLCMVFLGLVSLPASITVAPRTQPQSTAQTVVEAEPQEVKFASESFRAEILVTFYQNNEWDGEPVRSYDGKHLATIDDSGMLIIDGRETYHYPDIPTDYACEGIYRDAADGTYACFREETGSPKNAFMRFKKAKSSRVTNFQSLGPRIFSTGQFGLSIPFSCRRPEMTC